MTATGSALRLCGEEPAGTAGRDPWSAADELVLRKIADAGLNGLSGMVNGTPQEAAPPPLPAPAEPGRVVASTEPPSPASGGDGNIALGDIGAE